MATDKTFTWGVGRRKTSVARVRMSAGKGDMSINGKAMGEYFVTPHQLVPVTLPLKVTDLEGKFDILVNVRGGGAQSQAEAVQLGIARALTKINEELGPKLKEHHLLTRDARMKERKKYGLHGARKGVQFSKR